MPAISAATLLVISGQVATEEALRPLFDFAGPEAAQKWQAVNDGVMGGVSVWAGCLLQDQHVQGRVRYQLLQP